MSDKKKDLPAMPFYIGDWKKDPAVQILSREQQMIWLDMLFLMWESKERGFLTINGNPFSDEMLSNALKLDNQSLTTILTYFGDLGLFSRRESDNAIYSRKIIKLVELSNKRKNAGSMGGNPNLVKQKLSKKEAKGKAITESENENENKDLINEFGFENFWNLYDKKKGDKEKLKQKYDKLSLEDKKKIFEYIPKYKIEQPDKLFRKNPETFLNNRSWNDEIIINNSFENKKTFLRDPLSKKILTEELTDEQLKVFIKNQFPDLKKSLLTFIKNGGNKIDDFAKQISQKTIEKQNLFYSYDLLHKLIGIVKTQDIYSEFINN
jgi:hypothetical protein